MCGLEKSHPAVAHTWYTDNTSLGDKFVDIKDHMENLITLGPSCGYFIDPTKIILVVSKKYFLQEQDLFWGLGLLVVTENRYFGGFLWESPARQEGVDE